MTDQRLVFKGSGFCREEKIISQLLNNLLTTSCRRLKESDTHLSELFSLVGVEDEIELVSSHSKSILFARTNNDLLCRLSIDFSVLSVVNTGSFHCIFDLRTFVEGSY